MGDKSNWKNKNRDILREPVFLPEAKKLVKKIKDIAKPFIKESIYIDKIIKSKKKDKEKD